MKDWNLSKIIPMFKKKGLVSQPENHRLLRLIHILDKVLEMGTAFPFVKEKLDEF